MSSILGDLLEEYREVVLPERGRVRATAWFAAQLASLVKPWVWGSLIGAGLGIGNLVATARTPLADDDSGGMLACAGVLLIAWAAISFGAARDRGLLHAIVAGLVAGTTTLALFNAANYLRVIMFVDQIRYRADWVDLMARFQASGASNLRWFVVRDYVRPTLAMTALGSTLGAASGLVGGLLARWRRPQVRPA